MKKNLLMKMANMNAQTEKYKQQIENYKNTLSKMNWNVKKGFLVFINDEIEIFEI